MNVFARGFRLHPRHGDPLDGAEFPDGRVVLIEDPEHGLRGGYQGGRIEWAGQTQAEEWLAAYFVPLVTEYPTLRERYAAALYEWSCPGYKWADAHPDDLAAYRADADVVIAVRDQPPAEHCGNQPPSLSEHTPHTECVLRPGHAGSHADERGMRWWLHTLPEVTG